MARRSDRASIARPENIIRSQHQQTRFQLRFHAQRDVHRHLIAVEVRIVGRTNQRMNPNGIPFDQLRFESLHRQTMEGRRTIQEHRMFPRHFIQGVPDDRFFALNHLLGRAHGVHLSQLFQTPNNERFEKNQSHFLGQSALVQLELWTDHDDGTARIIHPLAKQVHSETTGLALQHVGKGFERTIPCSRYRTTVPTIIHQGIDRLLQHPLFITNDDFGSLQLKQITQPVIPIDHPAIKIIQIGSRKPTTFQRHQRT